MNMWRISRRIRVSGFGYSIPERREIRSFASFLGRNSGNDPRCCFLPFRVLSSHPISIRKLSVAADNNAYLSEDDELTSRPGISTTTVPHIRNVAIVAHVDHGKTTLVDELLKCTRAAEFNAAVELVMDSGELERERGITITSKVTRMDFSHDETTKIINVVDTPGHADFAGEVDRILSMIDGVCLLVDAAEGAMAQTKYVLSRALNMGITPVVVLNKCDKADAWHRIESGDVEIELMELFEALGATDAQMDYVTVYSSGRSGWATTSLETARKLANKGTNLSHDGSQEDTSMKVLLNVIMDHVPPPRLYTNEHNAFSMAATTVGYDPYLGRMCTGRIYSGTIAKNDAVMVLPREVDANKEMDKSATNITGVFVNRGVQRTLLDPPIASVGDIVTLAGVPDHMAVGDTLTSAASPVSQPIETPPLAPPTLSMEFGANVGPLAGKEGTIVASSRVRDRINQEMDNNVTLSVTPSESDSEKSRVHARGELQLGILIEQMRREGYELSVSPPKIITTICPETKQKLEPFEEVTVDVDGEYSGTVVNLMTGSARKGVLLQMSEYNGKTRLQLEIPSRGLLGLNHEIATLTRGSAVLHHCYLEHRPWAGNSPMSHKGRLVSSDSGKSTLYALHAVSDRGTLYISPGDTVFAGMVIGETNKPGMGDLEVNPVKAKAVNNMRTVNKDEKMFLPPPKQMTVEEYIGYMGDDEILEVTPQSIRLRKTELDAGARQRALRNKKKQIQAAKQPNSK